jgi:hypothetical protein
MTDVLLKGSISFINYEKNFATIEYQANGVGKQKSVNFKTNEEGRKSYQYKLGDVVSFQLKLSDRGDKMTAYQIKFLYNTAIDLMIQKATIENRFSGYLKKVEDQYFVKEWNNYILFPLLLSPWEVPPVSTAENEPITFRLVNIEKPSTIAAELFSHNFVPEYKLAQQHFENKAEIEAVVFKVSPKAIYLKLLDNIQGKLNIDDSDNRLLKEGDRIKVAISYLSTSKIVVKRV